MKQQRRTFYLENLDNREAIGKSENGPGNP